MAHAIRYLYAGRVSMISHSLCARFQGHRGSRRIVLVGGVFAVSQACWFTFAVTYLVTELGYPLALAGMVFAAMQAAGVMGRVALGIIADRTSSELTLAAVALLSAAATAVFAFVGLDWPVWSIVLLLVVAGATVSGWNVCRWRRSCAARRASWSPKRWRVA